MHSWSEQYKWQGLLKNPSAFSTCLQCCPIKLAAFQLSSFHLMEHHFAFLFWVFSIHVLSELEPTHLPQRILSGEGRKLLSPPARNKVSRGQGTYKFVLLFPYSPLCHKNTKICWAVKSIDLQSAFHLDAKLIRKIVELHVNSVSPVMTMSLPSSLTLHVCENGGAMTTI